MTRTCWALLAAFTMAAAYAQVAGVPVEKPVAGFHDARLGRGRTLRYKCAGHGSPTVIIQQGMGISVETVFSWDKPVGWAAILPRIAAVTQVCVYDRAGLGLSSKLEAPGTSLDAARDLHEMLGVLRIPPPYVLAGQSLGGMDALMFAATFPDTLSGLILIESAHPRQQQRFAEVLPPRGANESELLRGFRDGPDEPVMGEWFNFPANSKLFQHLPQLGDKPLVVLTRDPKMVTTGGPVPPEWESVTEPVWQQLQDELAAMSSSSRHIVVDHASHNIQLDSPDSVVDAILGVVKQVRAKPPQRATARR